MKETNRVVCDTRTRGEADRSAVGDADKKQKIFGRIFRQTKIFRFSVLITLLLTVWVPYTPKNDITKVPTAEAASVGQLQGQLNGLNGQIDALKNSLAQKRNEKATLENQIAVFTMQIDQLNLQIQATATEIEKTKTEIAETEQKIAETEAELLRQKELIKESLRVIYEDGRVSAVEVVASSDDFSEFLNRSQYLQTAQEKVQQTADKIKILKEELDSRRKVLEGKKSDLDNMKKELEGRQADLASQKAAKDALLAQTNGQEAAFQTQLDTVRNTFNSIQSQIDAASGAMTSYGNVKRGQTIGLQGNTGYSFGSHLHFGVYRGSQDIDPQPYLDNGTFSYPLVNPTITQTYWGIFSHRGVGWPGGIDMSQYFGAPIRASADGTIILNSFMPGGFGHYIIIDHGNGLRTLYAHMQ